MTKSISIVIPSYNDSLLLTQCLRSIAVQTDMPDQVLVIDNNSRDDPAAVVREFPFASLQKESHQGIVYARDHGFDATGGDIIARIDADSMLPPDWVARIRHFYDDDRHDRTALTGGGYFYNLRWKHFNGWVQSQFVYRLNRFVVGHYVLWGSNMALPRQLWLDVRGNVCRRNDIHEDLDLSFHLHDAGAAIHYDSSLKVGVKLKRIYSDRRKLREHMRRWPQSLRVHGYRHWWLGVAGNWFLWLGQPLIYITEYGARLLGRTPFNS